MMAVIRLPFTAMVHESRSFLGPVEMDLIICEVLECTSCGVRQTIGLRRSRRLGTGWAEHCMLETGQAVLWIFWARFWNYRFLVLRVSVQYDRVHALMLLQAGRKWSSR